MSVQHNVTQILVMAVSVVLAVFIGANIGDPVITGINLYAVVLLLLASLTHLRLENLVPFLLVADVLVHLAKRLVCFVTGSPWIYYATLFFTVPVYAVIVIVFVGQLRNQPLPASGKFLTLFLLLAAGLTLLAPSELYLPPLSRVSMLLQNLLPAMLYYAGCALSLNILGRLTKVLFRVSLLALAYGFVQFFTGPTPLDVVWATQTYRYSIQGSKVFAFLQGPADQFFYGYSFFPDPLTWGLFLNTCLVLILIQFHKRRTSLLKRATLTGLFLFGLLTSLTRSPWLCLLSTVAMYQMLRLQVISRAWQILAILMCLFPLCILGSDYLIVRFSWAIPEIQADMLRRFATVGTLGDRVYTWDVLQQIFSRHFLMGNGYGYSEFLMRFPTQGLESARVHNFVLALVMYTGLPGLLLFLAFYVQWCREAFRAIRQTTEPVQKATLRWLTALSFGYVSTGFFSGPNFMTALFFLLAGMVATASRTPEPSPAPAAEATHVA